MSLFSSAFFITNGASLLVMIVAFIKPALSRMWLGLIFIAAAIVNGILAARSPESYLSFAGVAVFDYYVRFIEGPFKQHVQAFVTTIAVLQLLTGIGMFRKGPVRQMSLMAAILFLLAIAPLGAGSAFPAPVLLAAACIAVLWKEGRAQKQRRHIKAMIVK